jgi:hypothetical protein
MPGQMAGPPAPPQQPMMGQQQQEQPQDAEVAAMLAIESLSPRQKALQRRQAQIDELRQQSLQGDARHGLGVLAKAIQGGMSGYQQARLQPEYESANEERREKMAELSRLLGSRLR